MSPRRRTLSLFFICISLTSRSVICQIPGVIQNAVQNSQDIATSSNPTSSQLLNTLITVASANGVLPNVLPAIQKIFPDCKNYINNEGIVPQSPTNLPTCQPYYQQLLRINNSPQATNVINNPNPLPPVTTMPKSSSQLAMLPLSPQQLPAPTLDQNCIPTICPVPPIMESLRPPQLLKQTESFTPMYNCPELAQQAIIPQTPSFTMPFASPFVRAVPLIPPPQNCLTPNILFEANQVPTKVFSELTPAVELPVGNVESADFCSQLPINFQINIPAPIMPEPVITVIPASPPVPSFDPSTFDFSSFSMYPYPIHIMERSRKSRWKSWLPILLIALLDGGCSNKGGGAGGSCCCPCCSNIPIPYPIPVPTNNPIILRKSDDR